MDQAEKDFPAETEPMDLKAEVASLRQQVWTLLVLLLVVSGTFSIYLMRQVTYARKDLATIRPQAMQIIQQFEKDAPGMDQFLQKLAEYSRTHPDFLTILNKYGITMTATQATPSATAPVSAPAAPKK